MLLGVDVGGTFTDAVLATDGTVFTAKTPTTPADQSRGVLTAVAAVLSRAGRPAADVRRFAHGMTVATNALLEGRAARTALIATEGFTDVIELGRQNRPELYRLCASGPAPLIPPDRRLPAPERMTPDGPVLGLSAVAAERLADQLGDLGAEAVAVVLLHSYRHPEHEQLLGETLRARAPDVHVSLSHETVGTFREYERAATTEIDAAISPLLSGYLRRLSSGCAQAGVPEPAIMQSSGGLIPLDQAAGHAALSVLSGPAGGAAGAAFAANAAGVADALCFDMGGTSCDVCVVDGGAVQERGAGTVAGRPLALPMLAIHTVGAGGGSIAWRDAGGALRVGPRSAGADPGPACYGRGNTEPTVTDANVVLGYLDPAIPLAGGVALDAAAAERAVEQLARSLELSLHDCAEGIRRVACAEMAGALRVVTVDRGVDPRDYALLAFGGAGGLHATDIADELGISRVLVPSQCGVLAALGLVIAPQRRDAQRSVFLVGAELTARRIAEAIDEPASRVRHSLHDPPAELRATYELRYTGQSFEIPVEAGLTPTPAELRAAFESEHQARYGYHDPEQEIELVTIRVSAFGEAPTVALQPVPGLPQPGVTVSGPTVLRLPESTVLIPAGWRGSLAGGGALMLERSR